MDYEKKYKNALEKAKLMIDDLRKGEDILAVSDLEEMFPELKESEDERIKRNIIAALKGVGYYDCDLTDEYIAWLEKQGKKQPIIVWHSINEEPEEMKELFCEWESDDATWHDVAFYDKESHTFHHAKMPINVTKWIYVDELLEKQGEQKARYSTIVETGNGGINALVIRELSTADKVEPKFKVGDYIVNDYCAGKVVALTDDAYLLDTEQGIPFSCEHNVHFWTIQDAKDGDVLAVEPIEGYSSSFVAIYKKQNEEDFDSYCFVGFDSKFYNGENGHSAENIHPATKEQRDTLEKAMADAGYTFDFEKKELKKIEQNPTWSEEDENYLQSAENACEYQYGKNTSTILWLKSLKNRIGG